jgi:hypothetical protein
VVSQPLNYPSPHIWLLASLVTALAFGCYAQVRISDTREEGLSLVFDGHYVIHTYNEKTSTQRQGSMRAPLESIDLTRSEVYDSSAVSDGSWWAIQLQCKEDSKCFTGEVSCCGRASSYNEDNYVVAQCSSRSECEAFLETLKQAVAVTRQRAGGSSESAQLKRREEGSALPSVERATTAPARPSSTPVPIDPLADILKNISWLDKKAGNSTLDGLGRKPISAPSRTTTQPVRPFYAAFAQSSGFNANDGWGVGTGQDLNGAISMANTSCTDHSHTTCGDEGYCLMKPGLWSAWASDQKYLGGKAFTCNLKTEEEAESQALTWCGFGCKVLWTGEGR